MAKSYIQTGPRVSASSGGGVSQPDIADVTNVLASVPEAVEVDGVVRAKVTIRYTSPANPGTGEAKFTGVKVKIQRPSSIIEGESYVSNGSDAADQTFDLFLDFPAQEEQQTIYLCSHSEKYTDPLVLKPKTGEKPGVTPHVTITMPADPLTGDAPDVLAFGAGTLNHLTGSFSGTGRWDRLNEKMLVDWGCLIPSQRINWSGVAIFIKVANGQYIQATGIIGENGFAPAGDGQIAHYDCIAIEGDDLPAVPENWEYIAVSYDRAGNPNRDQQNNPKGPSAIIPTLALGEKPDFNRPTNPVNLNFVSAIVGPEQVELTITYNTPVAGNFIGVQFYLESPAGSIPVDLGSYDADLDNFVQIIKIRRPTPSVAQMWKLWAVPYGKNYATRLDASCPSVTNHINPYPYSPAVTNVSAQVKTDWTDSGSERYGFKGTFTVPNDDVFRHCEITAQFAGENREIWMADEADGDFDTSMWPMPANTRSCTIRFYSVNKAYQKNVTNVPSVVVTVGPTIGTAGQERAPFVTNFVAYVEYGYNEAGDQTFRFHGSWTDPASGAYKGAIIYCKDQSGRVYALTGTETRGTFRTDAWTIPATAENFTLHAVSVSGAGENTIVPGTPSVVLTVSAQLGAQAQEVAEMATGLACALGGEYDELGGQKYWFQGHFAKPATTIRYRGAKIMGKTGSDPWQELAYCDVDQTSFRSTPMNVPDAAQTWMVTVLSVDANNRANTYVPNVTPVVVLTVGKAPSGSLKLTRAATGQLGAGLTNTGTQIRIPDFGVSEQLLAGFAVSQSKLANMQIVDAARLVDGAVSKMKLQNAKIIDAARIEDLAVGTAAMQFQSVDNLRVKNAAIDGLKLALAAVGTANIQDLGVTWAKIANLAVDNSKVGFSAIQNANILDGTIQNAKIANLAVSKLLAGTANFTGPVMFSSTSSLSLYGGSGIHISPGTIYGSQASFKLGNMGWDITPGQFGSISGHGHINANGGFRVNGVSGMTASFLTGDGRVAYFSGGILTGLA